MSKAALTIDANTILLLDLSGYIFRAYHAIAPLTTSKGFPTNAIFGVTNMLEKLLGQYPDANIVAVKDAPGPSWRNAVYPAYKANRPPAPEDLKQQFEKISAMVEALGLPSVMLEGHEADDLIAGLAIYYSGQGKRVAMLSADKDLLQLIEPNIVMWDPMRNTLYDRERTLEKWGVPPERIPDLFALMGDSSDNVPGVPGIGPKRGSELIAQYGDLDQLLANLESLPKQKWAQNLRAHVEDARLSYRLVRLPRELPAEISAENLQRRRPNPSALRPLFLELEFHSQFERLSHLFDESTTAAEPKPSASKLQDSKFVTILADADLQQRLTTSPLAFDTETTSLQPRRAQLVGFSGAAAVGEGWYVPLAHKAGPNAHADIVLPMLRAWAEDPKFEKWGQNLKYDTAVLKTAGIELRGIGGDSMLASYLLNPDGRSHGLDALAERELGHQTIKFSDVADMGDFRLTDVAAATAYAAEDAVVAQALCERLHQRLRDESLWDVYTTIELPLVPVLASMEWWGIRVDAAILADLKVELQDRITKIEAELMRTFKRAINLQSPKQIGEMLFDELKLPTKGVRKTKTGAWSTDVEVLENLQDEHPVVRDILEHRSLSKLLQTYVVALTEAILPETGRIHPSFQQAVAATGRLSCNDPNLQNIPIRDHWGHRIRSAFVPADGFSFIGADYSQIELRILAHVTGDPGLCGAFARGEDIHARTAAEMLEVDLAAVTPEHRRIAKTINFGLMYGMGAQRLAKSVGIGQAEAKSYIERYFARFSSVRDYKEKTIALAREQGYVATMFGRKRWVPDITGDNKQLQLSAERIAINAPIQGAAADIMKLAMIAVHHALNRDCPEARILLQVHDELLIEAPTSQAAGVQRVVIDCMQAAANLAVPLLVESAIGATWDSAH